MIYLDGKRWVTPIELSKIMAIPKATTFYWSKQGQVGMMALDRSTLLRKMGYTDSIYLIDYDAAVLKKAQSHLTLAVPAKGEGGTDERRDDNTAQGGDQAT